MKEMKSLYQIIAEKGEGYEFEEIVPDQLIGLVKGEPRVIRAILDRTAVVHPFNDASPDARKLAKLPEVMVWERDIKWRRRPISFALGHGFTRLDSSVNRKRTERYG